MRVGILHSGGKDSTYAAWIASKRDQPACLITLFPQRQDKLVPRREPREHGYSRKSRRRYGNEDALNNLNREHPSTLACLSSSTGMEEKNPESTNVVRGTVSVMRTRTKPGIVPKRPAVL